MTDPLQKLHSGTFAFRPSFPAARMIANAAHAPYLPLAVGKELHRAILSGAFEIAGGNFKNSPTSNSARRAVTLTAKCYMGGSR
jgi:hypothetical protein